MMKKALLAALVVMGTTAALTQPVPASQAAPGDKPEKLVCDNTKDDPYTGTYKSVTVPEGASCYLEDATVTHNLMARDAVDVYVVNTEVQRNLKVRGATRDVVIGPKGCKFDPPVGNNVMVTGSHNVAICFTTADNNITVARNDGRIIVRDSVAGNSIRVTRNFAYNAQPGDGEHENIAAIRLRDNVAERHIDVRRNEDRPLILKNNTPEPLT